MATRGKQMQIQKQFTDFDLLMHEKELLVTWEAEIQKWEVKL